MINIKKIIREEVDDFDWMRGPVKSFVEMFMDNIVDKFDIFGDADILQSHLNTQGNKEYEEKFKNLIEELGMKISRYSRDVVQNVHGNIDCHDPQCNSIGLGLHFHLSDRTISIYSNRFNRAEIYDNMDKNTELCKRLRFPVDSTLTKYI